MQWKRKKRDKPEDLTPAAGDSIPQAILDGSDETNLFETSPTEKNFNSGVGEKESKTEYYPLYSASHTRRGGLTSSKGWGGADRRGPRVSGTRERVVTWRVGPTRWWLKGEEEDGLGRLSFKPAGRLWRGRRRQATTDGGGGKRPPMAATGEKTAAAGEKTAVAGDAGDGASR
uniref:Uncharacterized protein n=2 Tax=Oryza sativa subsp. japonica TaxID=39947 RepID=Q69S08_ORYSJ|nr:hypothetical protein OSJNBa0074N12.9 [Oryza sativa Japonica Group]AAQ56483.1 hypothetical protein OSJNBa0023H09.6 [Oryza sativa Japonica Group]BAD30938.1 hypothetical protein [Oryza sativa Japonica Group]BAD30972.1 hypothetical protein [Oryza sativa Japonica Group]